MPQARLDARPAALGALGDPHHRRARSRIGAQLGLAGTTRAIARSRVGAAAANGARRSIVLRLSRTMNVFTMRSSSE